MSPPYSPSTSSAIAPHCEPRREEPRSRRDVLADVLARVQECRGYVVGQMDATELEALNRAMRHWES